ncbi:hypothetical protein B4Q13_19090 [Lacticaseibacillus rhamnosus]
MLFGALVIMFQCKGDYFFQVLRIQFHILSPHNDYAISCVKKIAKWYFSFVTNCKLDACRGSWGVNEPQCDSTRMPCAPEPIPGGGRPKNESRFIPAVPASGKDGSGNNGARVNAGTGPRSREPGSEGRALREICPTT